ncbi:MAG: tetratricopeptide repeat protein, partial [Gemmataceae bacterium]|nr:tetratricopeptide repeat protein [Gemmataceae bacterium]
RARLAAPFPAGWDRPVRDHLKAAERDPALIDRAGLERQIANALAGDPAAVAAVQRRAADGGPDAVPLLEALTRSYLDAHRLADAGRAAGRLLAAAPDHPLGYFWRGLVLDLTGHEGPAAEADLRKAVELAPGEHAPRLWLAGYLARFARTAAEGQRLFADLARERPDDPDLLAGLGAAALTAGDPAAARPALGRLLELAPDHPAGLALWGRLILDEGDPAGAEPVLRRAAERSPHAYDPNAHLAVCLFRLGKEAEATAFRERAERAKADQRRIVQLLQQDGDRPAAAAAAELGTLYLRTGQPELGRNWLRRALEIDPGYEPARKALAEDRAKAGG